MLDTEFADLCIKSDLQIVQDAVNKHGDHLLKNSDAFYRASLFGNLKVAK